MQWKGPFVGRIAFLRNDGPIFERSTSQSQKAMLQKLHEIALVTPKHENICCCLRMPMASSCHWRPTG